MGIKNNIEKFRAALKPFGASLIAVSKTHPIEKIKEAYDAGQRAFGENRVQELQSKQPLLPADLEWHLIGHLQRNKVKYIAPFVSLIHSVDSLKLLEEINKQAEKHHRVIHCLLQVYIAREETKFGLDFRELQELIQSDEVKSFGHVSIDGLMGIASLTDNTDQVRNEFRYLKKIYDDLGHLALPENIRMRELSMGMSSDFEIALEEGSTMIRIGTAIFGARSQDQT
jgi:pyridoxal phosphate enzyme (YggS family)